MKKYSYKFTKTMIVAFIAGILVAVACIALNAKRFYDLLNSDTASAYNYVSAGLAIVVGLAGIVILIALIFSSYYTVDDKYLTTKWGLIKSQIAIKQITRVTLYRASKKLVVSYNKEEFTVICIEESMYDDFADFLKSKNSCIFYGLNSEDSGEK